MWLCEVLILMVLVEDFEAFQFPSLRVQLVDLVAVLVLMLAVSNVALEVSCED